MVKLGGGRLDRRGIVGIRREMEVETSISEEIEKRQLL